MDMTLASLAHALADPVRLVILHHLMGGPTTVSDIVSVTGGSQSNISNHLAILRESKLVRSTKQGRHHVYEIRDQRVAQMIEAMAVLTETVPEAVRQTPALARARTCYDHLAGQLGVDLFASLLSKEAVTEPKLLRTLKNPGDAVELGPHGRSVFEQFGLDVDDIVRGRGPYAFACRDWTEHKPHLGGRLGAAMWGRMIELGWVERQPGTRQVLVTPLGRDELKARFGVQVSLS